MENKTIEFSVEKFRKLLNDKFEPLGKLLNQLELLGDKQNEEIINKLVEDGIFPIVNNQIIATGIKLTPANGKEFSDEENNDNLKALNKAADVFMQHGGKNTVAIEYDSLNDLELTITKQDILNCIK